MSHSTAGRYPLLIAGLALMLSVVFAVDLCLGQNDGRLVYPLDDPYIHMAMAGNLAENGVWGVTRHGFSSSTSSPLWVLLLAASFRLFGVNDVIPLTLNLILAMAVLWAAERSLRSLGLPPPARLVALLALSFLTSLPGLVFLGQEHVIQVLLCLLFASTAATQLSQNQTRWYLLPLLAAPMVSARMEGLFLVATACLLLLLRRRVVPALLTLAGGLLPVVVYGLVSLQKGWLFLPNPVAIKGNSPDLSSLRGIVGSLGYDGLVRLGMNPHLLVLLLACLVALVWLLRAPEGLWRPATLHGLLFVGSALLQMQYAGHHSYFRYEAWVVALGLFALAVAAAELKPSWSSVGLDPQRLVGAGALVLLVLLALAPLVLRGKQAFSLLPTATRNIYEQQIQMALFIREHYSGESVALNDIGAVNHYADIHCVDVWGLASMAAARATLEGRVGLADISALAREDGARVAAVYFQLLPPWQEVGSWTISNNHVCASDTVRFFALDDQAAALMAERLRSFSTRLPIGVTEQGIYLDKP